MGPSNTAPLSVRRWQTSQAVTDGPGSQPRRDNRHDETWVEISSQPSSSSLSSIGDEVITTGLRVGEAPRDSRQRRPDHVQKRWQNRQRAIHLGNYDELEGTESEDDHFLASSGEKLSAPSTPSHRVIHPLTDTDDDDDDDDDDDENATALGRLVPDSPPPFRPQPNVFSHPPTAPSIPPSHPHSAVRNGPGGMRNLPNQRTGGLSFMSGGVGQTDNDAALRASLTTLLSCAAAARGIPKDPKEAEGLPIRPGGGVTPGHHPVELRLVQEADLLSPSPMPCQAVPQPVRRESSSRRSSSSDALKPKRRSAPSSSAKSPRVTKKKRSTIASEEALINPTLLTWVVSASVVVLVSVVGFGAGYVIGREVGKQEGMGVASVGLNASSVRETAAGCGREVIRGSGGTFRRLRWGTDIARSVVAS